MNVTTPIDELSKNIPWSAEYPTLLRFVGASPLLGALGLVIIGGLFAFIAFGRFKLAPIAPRRLDFA